MEKKLEIVDIIVGRRLKKWKFQVTKKEWIEKRWRRIVRFRLGNEVRGRRYCEKEDKKICFVKGRRRLENVFGRDVEHG